MNELRKDIEFVKTSSKGQVVIPSSIRKKLSIHEGSVFVVTTQNDIIVFKKVKTEITTEDLKTLNLVEEAWNDIEKGRYKLRSKDDFFKELKEW
ncbi:transcriptional regulator, AbrB family [Thermoplasmatales archaeon]|nr:transcriptional regulator, AbrB family [Thermoplasmatales archaeon]